jgi:organic radical activating enzyme
MKTNSLDKKLYEQDIKNESIPRIIFGAGIVGEALFYACNERGMKINAFADNNFNKTKSRICNTEIIHTSELKKRYADANFIISTADVKDVITQLTEFGFSKWNVGSTLLKDFDLQKYEFSAPKNFVEYAVDVAILCQDSYLNPNKLFLRSVDLIITERCSLKCKDCSNLMQYYQNPKNCEVGELERSIDSFCNIIDEINEFRILGGEPFMNKEFDKTIDKLTRENKVKKIVVYTNGTIVPKEDKIKSLSNEKTLVLITDYGILSKNIDSLVKKFSEYGVNFYIQKAHGWTNCSEITKHNRNVEQQKKLFRDCCAKNTFTISEGRLYRCPFGANLSRLKAIPDYKEDKIDFINNLQEISEIKKNIKDYIFEKDFLNACDYCNGRSFGESEIEPAIQIQKPLKYEQIHQNNKE